VAKERSDESRRDIPDEPRTQATILREQDSLAGYEQAESGVEIVVPGDHPADASKKPALVHKVVTVDLLGRRHLEEACEFRLGIFSIPIDVLAPELIPVLHVSAPIGKFA
jgi:hypothetical protein